jgi:hypothetical protein
MRHIEVDVDIGNYISIEVAEEDLSKGIIV